MTGFKQKKYVRRHGTPEVRANFNVIPALPQRRTIAIVTVIMNELCASQSCHPAEAVS